MKEAGVFLVIEKGEPFQYNDTIVISKKEYVLGRKWKDHDPDISFSSLYISRKHAVISYIDNQYVIVDLNSKSGTQVNGQPVSNKPRVLKDGDRINLAMEEAVMVFHNTYEKDLEHTLELKLPLIADAERLLSDKQTVEKTQGLFIHLGRREVLIDGLPLFLSGKDVDLLMFLYEQRNQAVSYDDIKIRIWPERLTHTSGEVPDVGRDEVNALVYRLRKKLGKYGQCIVTIPRYGYMLDL